MLPSRCTPYAVVPGAAPALGASSNESADRTGVRAHRPPTRDLPPEVSPRYGTAMAWDFLPIRTPPVVPVCS